MAQLILSYTEIESAKEKMFKEKQHALMQEANETAKRKQKEMDKKRTLEKRNKSTMQEMSVWKPFTSCGEADTTTYVEPVHVQKSTKSMKLVSRGKQAPVEDF